VLVSGGGPDPGRWLLRVLDAARSDRTADRAMVCGCDP